MKTKTVRVSRFWADGPAARLMRGVCLGVLGLAFVALTPQGFAQNAGAVSEEDAIKAARADVATKDVLIFKNGNVVEGKILSETDTKIKVLVKLGNLSAPTEYSKSEILEVQRDVPTGVEPTKKETPTDGSKDDKKPDAAASGEKPVKIYLVEMKGEAYRDVSQTPMRKIVRDIIEQEPDYVVYKMDFTFSVYEQEIPDWMPDFGAEHYDMLENARELDTIINDGLSINYPKAKKPELVCWINKALGGAAFIPLSFRNTYYTSQGKHGGLGYLDFMFAGVGDEVVRQKQRSLRLGRAVGLGNKGGYPPIIVRGMSNTLDVISVDFVGGRPVYHDDASGSLLLTDTGVGSEQDAMEDVVRGRGNDTLTLSADTAYKLGISKGTADSIDELAHQLGVSRNYVVIRDAPDRILKNWTEDVNNAETTIRRLLREFGEVQVQGDYNERKAARGKQLSILQQASSLYDRYKESVNPMKVGNADAQVSQISVLIEQIKTQQRLDRRM